MSDEQAVRAVTDTTATVVTEASWLQTRAILRLIFIVLVLGLGLWMLYTLTSVILLVILAVFFAYLVAPLVELACRPLTVGGRARVMPRALAIGVVYLLIFGSMAAALRFLLPRLDIQITQFAQQVPDYVGSLRAQIERWALTYENYRLPAAVREAVPAAALRRLR